MPLSYLQDRGYSTGMHRDESSWLIPNGGVYDSLNMLSDRPGILRQRGGSTNLVTGAQTAFATSIGFCYSQDGTPIEELYGLNGKDGALYVINKTTGAATNISSTPASAANVGRPVRHFGFLVFPAASISGTAFPAISVAGQASSTTFAATVASTITAGNPQITLAGGGSTANVRVGAVVSAGTGVTSYTGRVVSVDSGLTFTVWPVPTDSFNPGIGQLSAAPRGDFLGGSGRCGASFQNRLLFGNAMDMSAYFTTGAVLRNDRRVNYSPLPTEATDIVGYGHATGAISMQTAVWPKLNYFDVPGADPIVAMEPIDASRLLILTTSDVMILSGNLVTQIGTTSPTITYDLYPFDVTSGCLSDLSVMRTPAGIMWAGAEGVFAYWPPIRRSLAHTGMRNLLEGKMLTYWQNLVSTPPFVIHGAAYAQNHYYISGTAGGVTWSLCCNLNNSAWTRLSGTGTDIFIGARRPTIPQQTFVARWWDQAGAAPSMSNGQVGRAESMFAPYVAGATKTDMDGATVPMSVTTRTITGDSETLKMFQRGIVEYQQSSTTAAVAVTAQSTIDAADTDASRTRALGNLSNTSTLTLSNATNATPIACTTTTNHGLQTDDFVDIDGVLGNLNANGPYRIAVTGVTTFTLVGSSGSAAYTSGGKVKKRTEQTFQMSPLNKGQGASLTISGSPNNIELHAVKLAVLQQEQVPA